MKLKKLAIAVALAALGTSAWAQQGETVRIAMIEGLSGSLADVGQNQLRNFRYLAAHLNAAENPAGVKFEFVPMDSKNSSQEALTLLKLVEDQRIHYVVQGNGSNVAIPLSEAVTKNNARNPDNEIVYLNYAAVDPALTNELCSYWHFAFDANTAQKMKALSAFLKTQPARKFYLMNQNYSHGHQVSKFFKENIAHDAPDARIVGEDYVALGQVKDFAPYVAKIQASGADAIVTGSWGQDFTLFVKALNDAGVNLPIYAYYAAVPGTAQALAQGHNLQVYQIAYNHSNYGGRMGELQAGFHKQYDDDFYNFSIYNVLVALSHAMAKAQSTDPAKVAAALDGLKFQGFNGPTELRRADHQAQQGLWISKWQPVDAQYKYDFDHTGHTFAPVKYIDAALASTPTTCRMKRPG